MKVHTHGECHVSVSTAVLPSDVIAHTYSGTNDHVSPTQRLTIERVENAYEAIGCKVSTKYLMVLDGNHPPDIHEAYPLWVVVASETGFEPIWLHDRMTDRNDHLGHVWLGMKLELEPDYLRGYTDGYFGQVPHTRIDAYRIGWRDGSEHHRVLSNIRF